MKWPEKRKQEVKIFASEMVITEKIILSLRHGSIIRKERMHISGSCLFWITFSWCSLNFRWVDTCICNCYKFVIGVDEEAETKQGWSWFVHGERWKGQNLVDLTVKLKLELGFCLEFFGTFYVPSMRCSLISSILAKSGYYCYFGEDLLFNDRI